MRACKSAAGAAGGGEQQVAAAGSTTGRPGPQEQQELWDSTLA